MNIVVDKNKYWYRAQTNLNINYPGTLFKTHTVILCCSETFHVYWVELRRNIPAKFQHEAEENKNPISDWIEKIRRRKNTKTVERKKTTTKLVELQFCKVFKHNLQEERHTQHKIEEETSAKEKRKLNNSKEAGEGK